MPPREHMVIVFTAAAVISYFLFVFMYATDRAQVEEHVSEALIITAAKHDGRIQHALTMHCRKYRDLAISSNADHSINLHQETGLLEIYDDVAVQLNTLTPAYPLSSQIKSLSDEEYVALIDSLRNTLNKFCSTVPLPK